MRNALVSDFDGTITRFDVYALITRRYMGDPAPDYFAEYRAGRMGHFEAMAAYFSHMPTEDAAVEELLRATKPDPELKRSVAKLKAASWDLIVVSAGSSWYIERIFAAAGVRPAALYSNPGRLVKGRGLVIERDLASPFYGADSGVDKAAVVRDAQARYDRVAFAGDGPPDIEPALLVPPDSRFARGELAAEHQRRNIVFRPFDRWNEVVNALV